MKRRAKARYSWDRKHGKCGGTGWVTVMASSRIGGKPMVAVEKCDCWRLISKVATVKKAKLYRDGKMEGAGG